MKYLEIETENAKGNEPKFKENLGKVTTFLGHHEDKITVDFFQGAGDSYKQREIAEIQIFHNGTLLFKGDKYELQEQLKK